MALALKHTNQQKGTENSEINLPAYGQLIEDKGANSAQRGKEKSLLNSAGKIRQHTQDNGPGPLTSHTKINSKMNQRPDCKTQNHKTARTKQLVNSLTSVLLMTF